MPELQLLLLLVAVLLVGVMVGVLSHHLWTRKVRYYLDTEVAALRGKVKLQDAIDRERALAMTQAEVRMSASFGKLANEMLSRNSEGFLRLARESLGKQQERAKSGLLEREKAVQSLVQPIQDALEKTYKQIGEIEKARHESFGSIKAQLEIMANNQAALQTHTRNLVTALRRPEVRGQWGELTLRRIAELAGMVEHCDFTEQVHTNTDDGAIRPDMIVHLPDRGEIIVDVKTPLDAYLQAVEAPDDAARKSALQRHAKNVGDRIRELSTKAYWSQFESSPEFVILFIPGDQFLSAALDENPNLLEEALQQKVIIATPTSLVALLKAIAYGWRQMSLAENADEIRRLAQDLYARLSSFTGHMSKLGKQIEGSVKTFNSAVGSLERSVLPGARKFTELGVQAKEAIGSLDQVETITREVEDRNVKTESVPSESKPPAAQIASVKVTKKKSDDSTRAS
jgi:DNA recombination protein RmuC